jgi:acyl carrier protein
MMLPQSRGATSRFEAAGNALVLGGIMLAGAVSGVVSLLGIRRYGRAGILGKAVTGLAVFTLTILAAIPSLHRAQELARKRHEQLYAQPAQQQLIDRIRREVAQVLKKDPALIDVATPMAALGADELDVVEIVMAVEEAFKVEIPDSAIGEKAGDSTRTLTIQKLAEIVSRQARAK